VCVSEGYIIHEYPVFFDVDDLLQGAKLCYTLHHGMRRSQRTVGSHFLDDLVWLWLLFYAHRHRSISGAAGHIILTPANQLMVIGLKIWSLSNPGFEAVTFRSLAQRAYHLR
jgi:hypothetical protein